MSSSNEITVTSVTLTPENVDDEAKKFAMRAGGLLLLAMAEKGITEKDLAEMLEIPSTQVLNQLMGRAHRPYLPLAALALAMGLKLELRLVAK